ncbi:MAG: hypothetical protein AAFY59_16545 [Pseudomonadota bacterium]
MNARKRRHLGTLGVFVAGTVLGCSLVLADASAVAGLGALLCFLALFFGGLRAGFRETGADVFRAYTERFGDKFSAHVFPRSGDTVTYLGSVFFLRGLILMVIFLAAASLTGDAL